MRETGTKLDNLKTQIEDWGNKIDELKNKRDVVGHRAKGEYDRQLDLMTSKLETLKRNLEKYLRSDSGASADLETVSEKLLKEIDDAFSSAISKLN